MNSVHLLQSNKPTLCSILCMNTEHLFTAAGKTLPHSHSTGVLKDFTTTNPMNCTVDPKDMKSEDRFMTINQLFKYSAH